MPVVAYTLAMPMTDRPFYRFEQPFAKGPLVVLDACAARALAGSNHSLREQAKAATLPAQQRVLLDVLLGFILSSSRGGRGLESLWWVDIGVAGTSQARHRPTLLYQAHRASCGMLPTLSPDSLSLSSELRHCLQAKDAQPDSTRSASRTSPRWGATRAFGAPTFRARSWCPSPADATARTERS